MDDLGRRDQGSAGRRWKRLGIIASVLTVGLTIGVAPVLGDGVSKAPTEVVVRSVPASQAQVAASNMTLSPAATAAISKAKKKAKKKKKRKPAIRRVVVESRITDSAVPIVTQEGSGNFVKIECPKGSIAISGGMITDSINLLQSSSSPNNPEGFGYTPRKWWVAVTNVNVDGQGGPHSWRGVVNCLSPAGLKK